MNQAGHTPEDQPIDDPADFSALHHYAPFVEITVVNTESYWNRVAKVEVRNGILELGANAQSTSNIAKIVLIDFHPGLQILLQAILKKKRTRT